MTTVGIAGVGVIGPGIAGWDDASAVLTDQYAFDAQAELPRHPPEGLPANERRRITPLIRMALQCCEGTVAADLPSTEVRSVFSSSCGDLATVDKILTALTLPDKPVSPTLFHNSVHNAAAGYWSISSGDQAGSTSISAHDSSFSAGLLEAVSEVLLEDGPVLLLVADSLAPPALSKSRPFLASFAIGLLLVNEPARWNIDVTIAEADEFTAMSKPALESMRLGNPAARGLPLLALMAGGAAGQVTLPYLENLGLVIDVSAHDRG